MQLSYSVIVAGLVLWEVVFSEGVALRHRGPWRDQHPVPISDGDNNTAKATCERPWDGKDVLGSDGDSRCHWTKVGGGPYLGGGQAPQMCLRQYPDIVSDALKNTGTWQDCPALAKWWQALPDESAARDAVTFPCSGAAAHRVRKLYVDVGSNIGACLVPMLSRLDVESVAAFEPSRQNQFYLTSTVLNNSHLRHKLAFYPLALGDRDSSQPMYAERGNHGNTVVGRPANASPQPIGYTEVRTLDHIFMPAGQAPPYVHLMKLDAQGYEVKILQGGASLFASGAVNAVKFELASRWLHTQQTTPADYLNIYLQYGYRIYDPSSELRTHPFKTDELKEIACGPDVIRDFVAAWPHEGSAGQHESQDPISC